MTGSLQIVAVGRLKTSHWRDAQQDYVQRLHHYTRLQLTDVKDSGARQDGSQAALILEGKALLGAAKDARCRILLTPDGKAMASLALAEWLKGLIERHQRLAFFIGGPLGVSSDVRERADHLLSLSSMTFPHELARVMLLEQLYRAFTLIGGEKYHK